MVRVVAGWVVAVLCVVSAAVAVPVAEEKPREDPRVYDVREKLALPVSLPGFEPDTPLKEALGFLSERFGVTILVDSEAFKAELMIQEPENQPVQLRQLINVRLSTALRLLLSQAEAGFYVDTDKIIWVVPRGTVAAHHLRQPIEKSFEKRPLQDALQELSELSGFNVVVDARRAGEKAKTPVTARLKDVSLEAAVRILADMAELKPVLIDKVLYVTTRENAQELQKELDQKRDTDENRPSPNN